MSPEEFVAMIAEPSLPGLYNPWSQVCPTETDPEGFRNRRRWLTEHLSCAEAKLLLIGEAPGYQGCRYSGVPFTSERLLLEGAIPRISSLLGHRITIREKPWSEPSATIVWKALHDHQVAETTVLFNAVPWHPEGKAGPHSNRTPNRKEIELGEAFLEQFLKLFPHAFVGAVGRTASGTLNKLGVQHTMLRHPANGGASMFRAGISELVRS